MNYDMLVASIIYLALFRMAIIFVGGMSIFLGYKLFIKGISSTSGEAGSGVEASFGSTSLSLTNAAPGTFFALFGIIVIGTMIVNSPAEISKTKNDQEEQWTLRGEGSSEDNTDLGKRLNNYAWTINDSGDNNSAVIFARLAHNYSPQNGEIIDTLAELLFEQESYQEALSYKRKAIELDQKFEEDLDRFTAALKK